MPDTHPESAWPPIRRRPQRTGGAWLAVLLVAVLVAALAAFSAAESSLARAPVRREQLRFMWAMAGQESGWDYYARNASSGAFGKYQIMPFNWPAWAGEYLGDRQADQTPYNQEKVAFGKIHDLYRWLASWKRVAYWWLTGSSDPREKRWSSYARGYVDNIMRLRKRAPRDLSAMPRRTSSVAKRGDWRRSGARQKLRTGPGKRAWHKGGVLRDGQVVKVRGSRAGRKGTHWIKVVTADGRLGWLRQRVTVPARRPDRPGRWRDVRRQGGHADKAKADRRHVRPRPR